MTGELKGEKPIIGLPFTVSREARRKALLATGVQVDAQQVMEVPDLLDISDAQTRERLVDIWERIDVHVSQDINYIGGASDDYYIDYSFKLTAYQWLRRNEDSWVAWDSEGNSIELERVFVATPGRTVNIIENARLSIDNGRELVDALLAGRPLVEALDDDQHLTLEIVLDAYDRALGIATELVDAARSTPVPEPEMPWDLTASDDERILLISIREGQERPPLGLCRASDPQAFEAALALVKEADNFSVAANEYFAFRSCDFAHGLRLSSPKSPPSDQEIVKRAIKPSAEGAQRHHDGEMAEKKVKTDYETDRQAWINEMGSNRLRLAAQREYRHDGLYRDERLAAELPGFVGNIGRRAEVKEIVNPSLKALEAETETLKLVKRQGLDVKVGLVWMKADPDLQVKHELQDGEYVEIEGFLGRHKVYRPVDEDPDYSDSDIPF